MGILSMGVKQFISETYVMCETITHARRVYRCIVRLLKQCPRKYRKELMEENRRTYESKLHSLYKKKRVAHLYNADTDEEISENTRMADYDILEYCNLLCGAGWVIINPGKEDTTNEK